MDRLRQSTATLAIGPEPYTLRRLTISMLSRLARSLETRSKALPSSGVARSAPEWRPRDDALPVHQLGISRKSRCSLAPYLEGSTLSR